MKILLAVDGSKASLDAVDWLAAHAKGQRNPPAVELVTVHAPIGNLVRAGLGIAPGELKRWYAEQGAANLEQAKKRLHRAGLRYRSQVLVGPVAETIVKHAREAKCGLIVIGASGMGAAGSLFGASVASKVLQRSTLPVLVAR
jgi:nucleotide-binding universal stress UspA family protein